MKEKLFFQLGDVRQIRRFSKNIENFDIIAREVQINYVERLIGSSLYAALQDDLQGGFAQEERLKELVEGVRYQDSGNTVIFRGLKDYACYIFIYLWLLDGGIQATPIGAQLFIDEEAKNADNSQQMRQMRDHCIRMADSLEEGVIHFLEKDDRFPEYRKDETAEPAKNGNFSFRAFVHTKEVPNNFLYR